MQILPVGSLFQHTIRFRINARSTLAAVAGSENEKNRSLERFSVLMMHKAGNVSIFNDVSDLP